MEIAALISWCLMFIIASFLIGYFIHSDMLRNTQNNKRGKIFRRAFYLLGGCWILSTSLGVLALAFITLPLSINLSNEKIEYLNTIATDNLFDNLFDVILTHYFLNIFPVWVFVTLLAISIIIGFIGIRFMKSSSEQGGLDEKS